MALKKGEIRLEEDEDEPIDYDNTIIQMTMREMEATKDEYYLEEFDAAVAAEEAYNEALEDYESGGTADALADADKEYERVR